AEMALGVPLFPGSSVRDELDRIFTLLGSPTEPHPWHTELAENQEYKRLISALALHPVPDPTAASSLSGMLREKLGDAGVDLVSRMLVFDPALRVSAPDALLHPFLSEAGALISSANTTAAAAF
ncbi:MAG: hypothetical protein SGCHY_005289, partial [Lobulomycetales sp.]